jgi:hypothetical protein
MRKHQIAIIALLALAGIPAGAFAAQPSHPTTPANTNANTNAHGTIPTTTTTHGNSATAKVLFVLHGRLNAFTAANSTTNGSVSITVNTANFHGKALKGQTLVFVVTSDTNVVQHQGAAIAGGDNGIVKVRAAKSNTTWTGLTARQVIDQGAPAS